MQSILIRASYKINVMQCILIRASYKCYAEYYKGQLQSCASVGWQLNT